MLYILEIPWVAEATPARFRYARSKWVLGILEAAAEPIDDDVYRVERVGRVLRIPGVHGKPVVDLEVLVRLLERLAAGELPREVAEAFEADGWRFEAWTGPSTGFHVSSASGGHVAVYTSPPLASSLGPVGEFDLALPRGPPGVPVTITGSLTAEEAEQLARTLAGLSWIARPKRRGCRARLAVEEAVVSVPYRGRLPALGGGHAAVYYDSRLVRRSIARVTCDPGEEGRAVVEAGAATGVGDPRLGRWVVHPMPLGRVTLTELEEMAGSPELLVERLLDPGRRGGVYLEVVNEDDSTALMLDRPSSLQPRSAYVVLGDTPLIVAPGLWDLYVGPGAVEAARLLRRAARALEA